MKQTLAALLTLLFVGSVLAVPITTTNFDGATDVKKGDINDDGKINAFDIEDFTMVVKYAWYYKIHYPKMFAAADINEDGMVGKKDIAPFIELLNSQ